jgi:hypothetical protein
MNSNSIIQLAFGAAGAHSTLARMGTELWTFQSNQAVTFLDLGTQAGSYTNILTGLDGLSLDPGSWRITNAGWSGQFTFDGTSIDLALTAVPEPSTWITAALAVGSVVWTQRRRVLRLCARRD